MNTEEFSAYRHEAVHRLMRLNEECEKTFQISSWPRWDYDLEAGTLTFSKDGIPKVIASILVAGTTSISGGTWLWGWANRNLPAKVTTLVGSVRAFGEGEGVAELTKEDWPDDEHLGWELTAIAARLLESKGGYCCPVDNGFVYVVYSSLRFADELVPKKPGTRKIECDTHGSAFTTYVCEHLVANPAQEWFSREPDDTNQWPDAWCAICDGYFQEEGEWNEKNESKLSVKLLCHHCYEGKRSLETSIT